MTGVAYKDKTEYAKLIRGNNKVNKMDRKKVQEQEIKKQILNYIENKIYKLTDRKGSWEKL